MGYYIYKIEKDVNPTNGYFLLGIKPNDESALIPFEKFLKSDFADFATTSTDPGTPTGNIYYICSESGTFTNFGNQDAVKDDRFYWNGSSWVRWVNTTQRQVFDETDPSTLDNPATGRTYIGTWGGRIWLKTSNGEVSYNNVIQFQKFNETDPTTIGTPESGKYFEGILNGKPWIKDDAGNITYVYDELFALGY